MSAAWKQENFGRSPQWALEIRGMRIVVHRHLYFSPDQWLLSVRRPSLFDTHPLSASEIEAAKAEALVLVRKELDELLTAVESEVSA